MIRLRYVHQWVDRRHGNAVARFYFRKRNHKPVPLPGLPGSAEFMSAYQAVLAGQALPRPSIGASRTKEGSLGACVVAYLCSPQFLALAPATQSTYRNILERIRGEHGDKPLALLTRQHINAMLAQRVLRPAAANHWLRMLKAVMTFAAEEGFRKDDPAAGIKRIRNPSDGIHTWTEVEVAAFEARHPIGTTPRLALALMLYTASRRSDVVAIGRQHIRDGLVHIRQKKTGVTLAIPLHPDLAAIIAATPGKDLILLTHSHGKPFTVAGFGNWFRDRCNEAGLKQCSAQGLRKAACRRLAEAGCSANVIASISGHKTLNEVARYTAAADQQRMARGGLAAIISRTGSGNRKNPVANSAKKSCWIKSGKRRW
jgi:integrase